jgi:hypothetical protein
MRNANKGGSLLCENLQPRHRPRKEKLRMKIRSMGVQVHEKKKADTGLIGSGVCRMDTSRWFLIQIGWGLAPGSPGEN